MGLKRAVKQFGVPRYTLQRRCNRVPGRYCGCSRKDAIECLGDIAVAAEKMQ